MKKHFQEYIGTAIGGVTGYVSSGVYKDWIQPMILSALCAAIGLLITHYGKKLLAKWRL